MKTLSAYTLAIAMATLTVGCKKDSPPTPTPAPTKTELLTAKNWKMTDFKINGQSVFNTGIVDDCEKDDLTKFNANKSTTFDEGTLKCDPAAPQTHTGSWEFTTNETKLKVTDPGIGTLEGTVGTLNSTTLTVSEPNYNGSGLVAETTFTAQ